MSRVGVSDNNENILRNLFHNGNIEPIEKYLNENDTKESIEFYNYNGVNYGSNVMHYICTHAASIRSFSVLDLPERDFLQISGGISRPSGLSEMCMW